MLPLKQLLGAGFFLGKVVNLVTGLNKEFTAPIAVTLEDPDSQEPVRTPVPDWPLHAQLGLCSCQGTELTAGNLGAPQLTLPSILDPPTKALSCIIPAYNEEDRLSSTLEETLA